jgi:hypothetical protein
MEGLNSGHNIRTEKKVRVMSKVRATSNAFGNEAVFLWERLSASIVAAGKPLPRGCQKATISEAFGELRL